MRQFFEAAEKDPSLIKVPPALLPACVLCLATFYVCASRAFRQALPPTGNSYRAQSCLPMGRLLGCAGAAAACRPAACLLTPSLSTSKNTTGRVPVRRGERLRFHEAAAAAGRRGPGGSDQRAAPAAMLACRSLCSEQLRQHADCACGLTGPLPPLRPAALRPQSNFTQLWQQAGAACLLTHTAAALPPL